ncbi:MAG: BrnT family toxin [Deltaproteobacteria bacterium]|nr:BrnT family toxin [Deltaproteobacteria bacterium]
MEISWDEVKAEINVKKHGISFEEAATVLVDPNAETFLDDHTYEDRFLTLGYSVRQRLLLVVWCERIENTIRIISARKATTHERKRYEERI